MSGLLSKRIDALEAAASKDFRIVWTDNLQSEEPAEGVLHIGWLPPSQVVQPAEVDDE